MLGAAAAASQAHFMPRSGRDECAVKGILGVAIGG